MEGGPQATAQGLDTARITPPPVQSPVYSVNKQDFTVWYSNCDQFMNKIDELKLRISQSPKMPSVIAVTEVNAKNLRYEISPCQLSMDNYATPIYNPSGRGMCIYVADHLDVVKTTLTRFRTEVTIAFPVKDKLCISCFYRSPSNTDNDNLEFITDLRTSLQPCLVIT